MVEGWRRAALWGMLAAKICGGWGVTWDIQWHVRIGRDSFWIPPHVLTYAAVAALVALSLRTLARETLLTRRGRSTPGSLRVFGLVGTRGTHLAWWGGAIIVLAAPVDDLWHRLFGLDVTLWSPPHLLGLLGSQVNSVGCLLLAVESYPPGHPARHLALLLGGTTLFGTFHLLLGTSILWAYQQGGLAFFLYPLLGSLFLTVALVPVARLSGSRWAPALTVALAAVIALVGGGVERAGFALFEPVPAIEEALAEDPSSTIATAYRMARENGTPVVSYTGRPRSIAWAFLPALVLSLADARRRPVVGSFAFAGAYLAIVSWSLAHMPALQPSLPRAPEILAGLVLVLAAGALGGGLGRALGWRLAPRSA